jgi:hypothetical protein
MLHEGLNQQNGNSLAIGVAEWQTQITQSLPEQLQTELPTIEELEAELEAISLEVEEG